MPQINSFGLSNKPVWLYKEEKHLPSLWVTQFIKLSRKKIVKFFAVLPSSSLWIVCHEGFSWLTHAERQKSAEEYPTFPPFAASQKGATWEPIALNLSKRKQKCSFPLLMLHSEKGCRSELTKRRKPNSHPLGNWLLLQVFEKQMNKRGNGDWVLCK